MIETAERRRRRDALRRDRVLLRLACATEELNDQLRDLFGLYAIPRPDEAIEVEPATDELRLRCPICRGVFDEHEATRKSGRGGVYMVPPCGHQIFVEPFTEEQGASHG